ncbi:MAG: tRNA pseudouridine(38-40) synthase TruA [Ignavibacteria bacterium]|nr:tRNA pseudouridine(38-40) synthase TruA [Ignavibacteria bacterium]
MKFRLALEYDGTRYSGWQKQKNARTIQGELAGAAERAFAKTKGTNSLTDIQGAGRTDGGVHAIEQTAHIECSTMLAPEILMMKLNDELPSDINILSADKAPQSFHARHSAVSRQYLYRISRRRTAFEKKYVWWIKDKLNISAMNDCAALLKGRKDFASFSEPDPDERSTLVEVEYAELFEEDDLILFRIRASHFLWKMVRRITGTLAEAGRGKLSVAGFESYLKVHSQEPARFTAPPSGLFLEKVYY